MAAAYIYRRYIFAVLFCVCQSVTFAQNEVAREQSSLRGIQSMGFTISLEKNAALYLGNSEQLSIVTLQKMGEQTLREGGITLIADDEVKQSDEIPFLYMHINTMDAGQGLIPFSISLYFYQPVKLSLNQDLQTTANTWETGTLGLVSYDRLNLIEKAVQDLLQEFIEDYQQINNTD